MPTPTATWLLLGLEIGEGLTEVAAGGLGSFDNADGTADGLEDGLEEGSTEEVVERAAFVVGVVLVEIDPRVVCIVAGPEPNEKSRDWVEQHLESSKP